MGNRACSCSQDVCRGNTNIVAECLPAGGDAHFPKIDPASLSEFYSPPLMEANFDIAEYTGEEESAVEVVVPLAGREVVDPDSHGDEVIILMQHEVGDDIGLNLDTLDGCASFVDGIMPGSIKRWNATHPPNLHLSVHDRIVQANGMCGAKFNLFQELSAAAFWTLTIQRPVRIHIIVNFQQFTSLGLDLKCAPSGHTLLISEIRDGAIKEWNAGPQQQKVQKNDRIFEVNGATGTARELLKAVAYFDNLVLAILHYSGCPAL